MRKYLLYPCMLGLIVAVAAEVPAATYQWEDSKGGMHFTDNPDNIPKKYRGKVRELESIEPSAITVIPETPSVQPASPKPADRAQDEGVWRQRYAAIRGELASIRERISTKKEKLQELRRQRTLFHKVSDRLAYNDLEREIGQDEERVSQLEKELANLDVEAAREAVPLEWRR